MPSRHNDNWYRDQARVHFEKEGTLEFDDVPSVSKNTDGDDGPYVQCWVWVQDDDGDDRKPSVELELKSIDHGSKLIAVN